MYSMHLQFDKFVKDLSSHLRRFSIKMLQALNLPGFKFSKKSEA